MAKIAEKIDDGLFKLGDIIFQVKKFKEDGCESEACQDIKVVPIGDDKNINPYALISAVSKKDLIKVPLYRHCVWCDKEFLLKSKRSKTCGTPYCRLGQNQIRGLLDEGKFVDKFEYHFGTDNRGNVNKKIKIIDIGKGKYSFYVEYNGGHGSVTPVRIDEDSDIKKEDIVMVRNWVTEDEKAVLHDYDAGKGTGNGMPTPAKIMFIAKTFNSHFLMSKEKSDTSK